VSPAERIEAAAERSPLVHAALEKARAAHAGQVRNGSGGMPYVEHPIAVAALLDEHGDGEDVLAAALLHDVV
jgi:(p)ppGpp synthase/HD superfamily hydrolase